jgi:hypothetical protein
VTRRLQDVGNPKRCASCGTTRHRCRKWWLLGAGRCCPACDHKLKEVEDRWLIK